MRPASHAASRSLPAVAARLRAVRAAPSRPTRLQSRALRPRLRYARPRPTCLLRPPLTLPCRFDLALGEVVGHFGPAFHAAYHSERPRGAGFEERRDLFVLYHLLSRQGADARRGIGPAGPQGYGATPRERGVRLNALVDRVIGSSGLR